MARACTIPGCTAPERCRGACTRHYYAARRAGTADALPVRYPHHRAQTYCQITGCGAAVHARGYCQRHYGRLRDGARWLAAREAAG